VGRGRLRGLVQNLGLLAAASLVAVAGAEWLLRTFAPQAGFVYRLDPRSLYSLDPGTRKLYRNSERNGGQRVLLVVNADGFRGDPLRRNPGLRVVVYGDSFVEADYTPLHETFTKRLEVRLASALGRDVEAVNAGVNGYGPDQALRRFEDDAGRLRPAAAVVVVYSGNDFGDVLRNRLYRLEGGRLVEGDGFVAESLWWQFEDARRRTPYHLLRGLTRLRNAHRRAGASTELPGQLARYVARSLEMCEEDYRRIVVQGERAVDSVFRDPYDADVAILPDSAAAACKRDLLEAVLGRWRQAAEAARVPVLAVVVPPVRPGPPEPHRGRGGRPSGPARPRAPRALPGGGRLWALPAPRGRPLECARPGPGGPAGRRAPPGRSLAQLRPVGGSRRNGRGRRAGTSAA
jgi:hypothetical protein